MNALGQARAFLCIAVSVCRASVSAFRGTQAGSSQSPDVCCTYIRAARPCDKRSARAVPAKLSFKKGTIRCASLATGVAPLAVPRSPGLSLRPCRSCVPLSGLFRRGGTFRWNLHDCFHFCSKNPCIWLCLARPLRSAERAGGTAGDGSEKCGSCVCGSVRLVVRWWLAESRLCSCRAINSSGSELCRSCDQLFVCGCYLPADWGGQWSFLPEGGELAV